MSDIVYLTKDGYDNLKKEIDDLLARQVEMDAAANA